MTVFQAYRIVEMLHCITVINTVTRAVRRVGRSTALNYIYFVVEYEVQSISTADAYISKKSYEKFCRILRTWLPDDSVNLL
jgi:hypothetical protein